MNKREKDIIKIVESAGLICVSIQKGGTSHYRVDVGKAVVTFASTPGDRAEI